VYSSPIRVRGTRHAHSDLPRTHRGFRAHPLLHALALAVAWALAVPAQAEGDGVRGKQVYDQYCAGCHGPTGRGSRKSGFMPRPVNLAKKDYIELLPDSYLSSVIAKGGASSGKSNYMPAFEGTLSSEDIDGVIAYIRTFSQY
jgi:mono/diheme cytochrome c family protein